MKRNFFFFAFGLLLACPSWHQCWADSTSIPFSIRINGKNASDTSFTIGSPLVSLEAFYTLPASSKFHELRVYRGEDCSLTQPHIVATWCQADHCLVGEQHELDISFESHAAPKPYFYVFSPEPRDISFSIELNIKDSKNAVHSHCLSKTIHLSPCDKILKVEEGGPYQPSIDLEFVDAATRAPLENVEVLLSRGPVPNLVNLGNGKQRLRSIPSGRFTFSFSRGAKQRFAVGPFHNQTNKLGLRKLQVALCSLDKSHIGQNNRPAVSKEHEVSKSR